MKRKLLRKWWLCCLMGMTLIMTSQLCYAENAERIRISGVVLDEQQNPLAGATITIVGASGGVIADAKGKFALNDIDPNAVLEVRFIGMESAFVKVAGKTEFKISLEATHDLLEDITVVAFSKQKKESVLSSITTVRPNDLKVPSSNLTTALSGRVAGLISYQQSGEPGKDNAKFFIRGITSFGADAKKDPLILIDNIELSADDLSRMNVDDIASFSIMKDAAATALYGARGANGVILVTTKEGREGKVQLNLRLENSFSSATRRIEMADPLTYMRMGNEAVKTRDPLGIQPYNDQKIAMTERGLYPQMYPITDWYKVMIKPYTTNQRANISLSGGGAVARYYVAGSFTKDNGNIRMDKKNNFNSNIDLKKYAIRSNINLNLTKTTKAVVRMSGTFDDYTGPLEGGASVYENVMRTNPVLFPPFYTPDADNAHAKHILFGNYGEGNHINPYAEMLKGYKDYSKTLLLVQLELSQDLKAITEGLSARVLFNTNRYSEFDVRREYKPFYYSMTSLDQQTGEYKLKKINPKGGSEWVDFKEGGKYINTATYLEGAVEYNRLFANKHNVGALMVFTMREYRTANGSTLQLTLPSRNLGLSGRMTYNYDSRYFIEGNFGYNGSERFSKNERWGFFPSVGGAWLVSNEKFFEPAKRIVSVLKLKGTYGLVGNDAIGSANDRFYYLSNVNMDTEKRGVNFGSEMNTGINGIEVTRYANDNISWETSYKMNLGFEATFGKNFTVIADYFTEKRTNILVDRIIPGSMGLNAAVKANLGQASSKGIDIEANYQQYIGKDLWITARGTFTYARAVVDIWEEPDYSKTPWRSRVGRPIGQEWGLIAERLFVDKYEIFNSPAQYGEYMPGDIKYKDINGDGKISTIDFVPIGHPNTPEINYGFGASLGYKNWDFSFFFQGSARQSFWIDPVRTAPFIDNIDGDMIGSNGLLKAYADNYWSEANNNPYALWPRLSNSNPENNGHRNTWFMQDASFIRLKSAEIGYTLPESILKKVRMTNLRIYVSGTNLLTLSPFKLWDPEMAGNGLGYPIQRVFNIGLSVGF